VSSDTKLNKYQGCDATPGARPPGPAAESGERAHEALIALVRLLARQAARETLSPRLQKETTDVDGKV